MTSGRLPTPCTLTDEQFFYILTEYSEGASDEEIKAYIWQERGSFSNDLWDRWLIDEPIFSETIKKGRELSKGWWHKQGRKNLKDSEFSPTLWYMNMKNRFGWRDNQNINHGGQFGENAIETKHTLTIVEPIKNGS